MPFVPLSMFNSPGAVPYAPGAVSLTNTLGTPYICAKWSAPVGGYPPISYRLKRCCTSNPGAGWACIYTGPNLGYEDTSTTQNTTYCYAVESCNLYGWSPSTGLNTLRAFQQSMITCVWTSGNNIWTAPDCISKMGTNVYVCGIAGGSGGARGQTGGAGGRGGAGGTGGTGYYACTTEFGIGAPVCAGYSLGGAGGAGGQGGWGGYAGSPGGQGVAATPVGGNFGTLPAGAQLCYEVGIAGAAGITGSGGNSTATFICRFGYQDIRSVAKNGAVYNSSPATAGSEGSSGPAGGNFQRSSPLESCKICFAGGTGGIGCANGMSGGGGGAAVAINTGSPSPTCYMCVCGGFSWGYVSTVLVPCEGGSGSFRTDGFAGVASGASHPVNGTYAENNVAVSVAGTDGANAGAGGRACSNDARYSLLGGRGSGGAGGPGKAGSAATPNTCTAPSTWFEAPAINCGCGGYGGGGGAGGTGGSGAPGGGGGCSISSSGSGTAVNGCSGGSAGSGLAGGAGVAGSAGGNGKLYLCYYIYS